MGQVGSRPNYDVDKSGLVLGVVFGILGLALLVALGLVGWHYTQSRRELQTNRRRYVADYYESKTPPAGGFQQQQQYNLAVGCFPAHPAEVAVQPNQQWGYPTAQIPPQTRIVPVVATHEYIA